MKCIKKPHLEDEGDEPAFLVGHPEQEEPQGAGLVSGMWWGPHEGP